MSNPLDEATVTRLIEAAAQARERAYAPYSEFRVGAALLDPAGRIHTGVNVENASLGLSVCAERNAIFSAVGAGVRSFVAVAVVTAGPEPASPCGACRQVLAEFAPDLAVYLARPGGAPTVTSIPELLPMAFFDFRPGSGQ